MTNTIKKYQLEVWKVIPGYEGLYEVSDLGRVRSLDRVATNKRNQEREYKGKILKPNTMNDGRTNVTLGDKVRYVHDLVTLAFIGEKPKGYDVCHINGVNHDNRLTNLRFDTRSQNMIDMYRYGKKHGMGKLTIEQVLEVRKMYATGKYKQIELAEKFNTSQQQISYIVNRKSYSWLNDDGSIDESNTAIN